MATISLNLSGHQNAGLQELGFTFPGTVQVDPTEPLVLIAKKYTAWLESFGIGSGDHVVVCLPGMSILAGICVSALHGMTGQFPTIVALVRQADGSFVPDTMLDLQTWRNATARTARPGIIEL